jgi:hypothetical protein
MSDFSSNSQAVQQQQQQLQHLQQLQLQPYTFSAQHHHAAAAAAASASGPGHPPMFPFMYMNPYIRVSWIGEGLPRLPGNLGFLGLPLRLARVTAWLEMGFRL